jgi:hypothetical protein
VRQLCRHDTALQQAQAEDWFVGGGGFRARGYRSNGQCSGWHGPATSPWLQPVQACRGTTRSTCTSCCLLSWLVLPGSTWQHKMHCMTYVLYARMQLQPARVVTGGILRLIPHHASGEAHRYTLCTPVWLQCLGLLFCCTNVTDSQSQGACISTC